VSTNIFILNFDFYRNEFLINCIYTELIFRVENPKLINKDFF